jgi:hypothetical protein
MSFVLVTQKIVDFDVWKSEFDSQLHARRRSGLIDLHMLRDDSDPSTLILLLGTTDLDKAREFLSSSDWQTLVRDFGVQGQPDIKFLNEYHFHKAR